MNKKAALELSINAIVVLILAITILGLGIGFIRSQFGSLQKQFTGVSKEIETQLLDKIRTSGELLVFNVETIDAKTGVSDTLYMGIKNTLTPAEGSKSVCFAISIKCIKALKDDSKCADDVANNAVVGGYAGPEDTKSTGASWFSIFDTVDIKEGTVSVYPVKYQIAKAKADTYIMELSVLNEKDNKDCTNKGEFLEFQKKQFFIVLS